MINSVGKGPDGRSGETSRRKRFLNRVGKGKYYLVYLCVRVAGWEWGDGLQAEVNVLKAKRHKLGGQEDYKRLVLMECERGQWWKTGETGEVSRAFRLC